MSKIPKRKLVKIDLSKRFDDNDDHPDIKLGKKYRAKIDGKFYTGFFLRQWYGWNFEAVYDAGYQLSYDGWQGLWEIR